MSTGHERVVDAHLHLFRPHDDRYPRRVYVGLADPEREALAPEFIAAMESAGVDHAVLVPLGRWDRYVSETIRAHPGRFVAIGLYDHDDPDDLAEVGRRHRMTPLSGLRFYGLGAERGQAATDLACFPVLRYMAEHGLVLWFYGDAVQIAVLDEVLALLPDLRVVFNHLGFLPDIHVEMRVDAHRRPHFDVALPPAGLHVVEALARARPTVHVHFSGHYAFSHEPYPYMDLAPVAGRLLAAFGPERILMGSDWPWIRDEPGYRATLALLDAHLPGLSPSERSLIRYGNAMRLFDFGSRPPVVHG
jgi:predicted TIM-barrel fold metal-dependent hydrolase